MINLPVSLFLDSFISMLFRDCLITIKIEMELLSEALRCEEIFEVFCLVPFWCNWLEGVTSRIPMSYAAKTPQRAFGVSHSGSRGC